MAVCLATWSQPSIPQHENPDFDAIIKSAEASRIPWVMPSPDEASNMLNYLSTSWHIADAWSKTAARAQKSYDMMVQRWNAELDYFLVYSGIFSSILAGFIVQIYPLLTVDSAAVVTSFDVALNVLLFSSLIFALGATTFALMIKQWIHEYHSEDLRFSKDNAQRRWYRSRNMSRWRVESIIASLFVLLQLSLVQFFAGILLLLWTLHPVVASIANTLVGIIVVVIMVTITLPVVYPDCCFISPPTYMLYAIVERVRHVCQLPRGRRNLYASTPSNWPPGIALQTPTPLRTPLTSPSHPPTRGPRSWEHREKEAISYLPDTWDVDLIIETILTVSPDLKADDEWILHLIHDVSAETVKECFRIVHDATRARDGRQGYKDPSVPVDFWIMSVLKIIPDADMTMEQHDIDTEFNRHIGAALQYIQSAMEAQQYYARGPARDLRLLWALTVSAVYLPEDKSRKDATKLLYEIVCHSDGHAKTYPWTLVRYALIPMQQRLEELLQKVHRQAPPSQTDSTSIGELLSCVEFLTYCCVLPIDEWEKPTEDNGPLEKAAIRAMEVLIHVVKVTQRLLCHQDQKAVVEMICAVLPAKKPPLDIYHSMVLGTLIPTINQWLEKASSGRTEEADRMEQAACILRIRVPEVPDGWLKAGLGLDRAFRASTKLEAVNID
ncbi:hypothetical protein C8Q74DRAFT_1444332 [Fomes fomentarius]|nr:hypothetical protein C8Q74DRAFT_1444332 [Fomes fomentarius]